MEKSHFDAQPFFVIGDEAYKRMFNKFINGEKIQYSYIKRCSHNQRKDCKCPKFANIMRGNKILRVFENEEKPDPKYGLIGLKINHI